MAKLNPLHTPEVIASRLKHCGHFDLERATGRTTALQLKCLAWAIENPFTPSYPKDHRAMSPAETKMFCEDVKAIAETLGLREIHINPSPSYNISFGRL